MRFPLPYAHPMALAPLDVWLRMLRAARAPIPLRHWPRLAVALTASAVATLVTLPERLLWRFLPPPTADPAPVFILGFYRSGTTQLHYLLARDPNLRAPRWCEVLAPQGFVLSWALLRLLLTPLMPSRRPIDGLPFGPELPAEEDFALNNGALVSPLAGRAVLPLEYGHYRRFDDLRELDAAELGRWRASLTEFVGKQARLAGSRRLLLKTPAHTARVAELLALYPDARFVHISREPRALLRSNLAMGAVLQRRYALQEDPGTAAQADRIAEEYERFERRYLEARAEIPPGRLVESRFEDLVADPLGELRRIHRRLDLEWSAAFAESAAAYLDATRGYRGNPRDAALDAHVDRVLPRVAHLAEVFGHDQPPLAPVEPPVVAARFGRGALAAALAGLACGVAWILAAAVTGSRLAFLVLPAGLAIGALARRATGRRASAIGSVAAAATALLWLAVSFLTARLLLGPELPASEIWRAALSRQVHELRWLWVVFGVISAHRLATRP